MKSLLYTPATKPEWAERAWESRPDAVILDLEDSVTAEQKTEARRSAGKIIQATNRNWFVRVNSVFSGFLEEDLAAVISDNLKGIILPKVESQSDITHFENILKKQKPAVNYTKENIKLIPIIETVKGVINIRNILNASNNISAIGFGAGDFSLDIGVVWDPFSPVISQVKLQLVLESRYAGLEPPHDTVYQNYRDPEGLRKDCQLSRKLGFKTKHAIHPDQISIINQEFKPTLSEVKWAKEIKNQFESSESMGNAAVGNQGIMIDYPVYKNALRILQEVGE